MANKEVKCLVISPFIDSETGEIAVVGSPIEVSNARYQRLLAAKVVEGIEEEIEEVKAPLTPNPNDLPPTTDEEKKDSTDPDVKNDANAAKNSKKGATTKADGAVNADDTDKG